MSHLIFLKCIHFSLLSKIWGHSLPSEELYFHLVGTIHPNSPSLEVQTADPLLPWLSGWAKPGSPSSQDSPGYSSQFRDTFLSQFPWEQRFTLLRACVSRASRFLCENLLWHTMGSISALWPPPPLLTQCLLNLAMHKQHLKGVSDSRDLQWDPGIGILFYFSYPGDSDI